MDIHYSDKAWKQIGKIERGDHKSAQMIVHAIERYADEPQGVFDVKILKGQYGQFKRLRVGNYRVIFDAQNNIMFIYEVKHRQGAYHD
ncbi:MAG: type II toxin-antitoxin system RelE/ParE family toxin [Candidatus Sumerlaeota bacterium]|nr:type II toxin-antitoxin system RelE/ParE family toxin [Candidatus Sumerlaeota bacterium]